MSEQMKYQLVDKTTNEILTPHYIGLAPNGELYSDGMNVTDRYYIRRFTGLKDINEVEIYEGDNLGLGYIVTYVDGTKGEDLGMSIGFYQQRDDFESWARLEAGDCYEVSGNIYKKD